MVFFYTPKITLLLGICIILIHISVAQQQQKGDQRENSLFEFNEKENNQENTSKLIEKMKILSPKDQIQDDEIKEIERMDRKILDERLHIKLYESEEDDLSDEKEEDQLQEEEDEEDDNGNVSLYFKNHNDTKYFENFPVVSEDHEEEDGVDNNNNVKEKNGFESEDEEDDAEEEEEGDNDEEIFNQPPIPQESTVKAHIPWNRPSHYGNIDSSSFYQDENATRVIEKSRSKVWHIISFLVILIIVYKWLLPRKKKSGLNIIWNKDENDSLPLHNKIK